MKSLHRLDLAELALYRSTFYSLSKAILRPLSEAVLFDWDHNDYLLPCSKPMTRVVVLLRTFCQLLDNDAYLLKIMKVIKDHERV